MSVIFLNVLFQNNTGIAIPLTIETPIGTQAYGPTTVDGNGRVDIPKLGHNCLSVRLIVTDTEHGATQDFVLALPGKGRPSYLEAVEVQFNVGDITGSAKAQTGDF
jgi:hypothetical protein